MRPQDSREPPCRLRTFSQNTTTGHLEPTSFLDCQDLSIAIDMTMANQNYVDQTFGHPDGLPGHTTSRQSSTAYPEIESPSYSATTFDHQHQINETHLLTPVSGVGSPCFQQSANLPPYPSTMTSIQPQASPSWHNSVCMSAAQSQVGSPMPICLPPSESHFKMGYIQTETDDYPEPPTDFYWGSYSVSAHSESEQGSMSPQIPPGHYIPHNEHHIMQPQPIMGQMPPELPMPQHHAPPSYYPQQNHTPWVEQPDIAEFKTTAAKRRQFGYALPSTQIARQVPIAQASGPSRPGRPQPVGRVARQPRVRGRATPAPTESTSADNIAQAQLGEPIPDLLDDFVIKEECDSKLRLLYQRQRDLTLAGKKGDGMWATIMEEFNREFEDDSDIPRLQMLVARGRYRDQKMSPRDEHIAMRALGFACHQFYNIAARKFKEYGGGQTTPWGRSHIECLAIDKGLVEAGYVPVPNNLQGKMSQLKTRRSKKLSNRLRSGAYSNAILKEAENNGGGVLEQDPQLYERVMDDIFEYRGEDGDEDEDDEAVLGNIYQTRSKGKSRQKGVNLKDDQGVDDAPNNTASTRRAAKPRRAPAKPRAKGRVAPKIRAP
ncbi:hypothetical protein LY76DRAFT_588060 [Colletotrichum caudatum]|nr:hypothetical protein LY76DRAFT_588060 [Colletotrichum caudatum]